MEYRIDKNLFSQLNDGVIAQIDMDRIPDTHLYCITKEAAIFVFNFDEIGSGLSLLK